MPSVIYKLIVVIRLVIDISRPVRIRQIAFVNVGSRSVIRRSVSVAVILRGIILRGIPVIVVLRRVTVIMLRCVSVVLINLRRSIFGIRIPLSIRLPRSPLRRRLGWRLILRDPCHLTLLSAHVLQIRLVGLSFELPVRLSGLPPGCLWCS